MQGVGSTKYFSAIIIAIIGGVFGGLIVLVFTAITGLANANSISRNLVSETPGMDALEAHRCPTGQKKIQVIRGIEDGFSLKGTEPAIIRPVLLELPYYDYVYRGKITVNVPRDFDETGVDKILFSSFEIPSEIASGIFVMRYKPAGDSLRTDYIHIGDLYHSSTYILPMYKTFAVAMMGIEDGGLGDVIVGDHGNVVVLDIADFKHSDSINGGYDLEEYLRLNREEVEFDVVVHDDTVVDFIALSLCQEPLLRQGVTMSVDSRKNLTEDVQILQCNLDPFQRPCDPVIGDTLCDIKMPLGCYKDGNRKLHKGLKVSSSFFVGGEVKVTEPIIGASLSSLAEADSVCVQNFGSGWRTLNWHEAGGAVIAVTSNLLPRTRMWVDVKDKPEAACWRNGLNKP